MFEQLLCTLPLRLCRGPLHEVLLGADLLEQRGHLGQDASRTLAALLPLHVLLATEAALLDARGETGLVRVG